MFSKKRTTAYILFILMVFLPIESYVSAANLLQKGTRGDQVVQLQENLKTLGVFSGKCTGYYGSVTQQAVKNLQRQNGYIQDGIVGSETLSLIDTLVNRNNILQIGSSGNNVQILQENLENLGYFSGEATGYYGPITKEAVLAFQKAYKLYADGKVGAGTASAIKNALVNDKSYSDIILKKGMSGAEVKTLQTNLKTAGFYSGESTGYFGPYTESVIKNIQFTYGYYADGMVGSKTYSLIQNIIAGNVTPVNKVNQVAASQTSPTNNTFRIPWYGQGENVFSKGTVAVVYDIETGVSFNIKRTFGYNHADCETLTARDTQIMYNLFGGWTWERRAVILKIGDTFIAASMAGMPHAGREDQPSCAKVYNRSGDYGYGDNLDEIKGNNMSGVFDVHLYMSKTHGSNRVDSRHQEMIDVANEYAIKNY